MFILILMLIVNLIQSLKYVFSLAMVMRNLAIGFTDEQNRKIIRSRNVIFNEQVMYKDRSTVVSDVTEIDQKKSEFVNLDELTETTVQKMGEEDKENVDSQVDQSTPVAEVRKSSKTIRPPQRYSPILNYLLLTDGGTESVIKKLCRMKIQASGS